MQYDPLEFIGPKETSNPFYFDLWLFVILKIFVFTPFGHNSSLISNVSISRIFSTVQYPTIHLYHFISTTKLKTTLILLSVISKEDVSWHGAHSIDVIRSWLVKRWNEICFYFSSKELKSSLSRHVLWMQAYEIKVE